MQKNGLGLRNGGGIGKDTFTTQPILFNLTLYKIDNSCIFSEPQAEKSLNGTDLPRKRKSA